MAGDRLQHLQRFYGLMAELERRLGGCRVLSSCDGRMDWPHRGVYFFYEPGENRFESGDGPRIVRVGTHALKSGASTKLWTRLSQHRGQLKTGGGYHRGSIFRLIVGTALMKRDEHNLSTWGVGNSATREIRNGEELLEQFVSKIIRAMPFLWLAINDEPGPDSLRGVIERNSIALLSNHHGQVLDAASKAWLGGFCNRERVRSSHLWNQIHVEDNYDPAFLDVLERLINEVRPQS